MTRRGESAARAAMAAAIVGGAWGAGGCAWLRADDGDSPPAEVASSQVGDAGGASADGAALDGDGDAVGSGVCATGSATNVKAVDLAAGARHACAVLADGTIRCWGSNTWGQLGLAAGGSPSCARPAPIDGIAGATLVGAGAGHTCAVLHDGSLACWGRNAWGQLGDATTQDRPRAGKVAGLPPVTRLALGGEHTCVATSDDAGWCWGSAVAGELGTGVLGDDPKNYAPRMLTLCGPTCPHSPPVMAIASGDANGCAIFQDHTAHCWGAYNVGQLGLGPSYQTQNMVDGTKALIPNASFWLPLPVAGITSGATIAVGGEHVCAVDVAGTVSCWGAGSHGQLGDGATEMHDAPTPIAGFAAKQIALGAYHTCAIAPDGGVWCWGANYAGQLGVGDTADRAAPVKVPGLAGVTKLALGRSHSCALLGDGGVRCWGTNDVGELGDGTTTAHGSPTAVAW